MLACTSLCITCLSQKLWNKLTCDAISLDAQFSATYEQHMQALRESGEKLAQLASDLSARMAAGQSGDAMDAGMARELIELGIVSPVTKQSAGKQYHEQLSRQLAEFLEKNLKREKGMMVLHDVYCLFNRCARPLNMRMSWHYTPSGIHARRALL